MQRCLTSVKWHVSYPYARRHSLITQECNECKQNGYDNSAPAARGRISWDQKAANQARSVAVVSAMAARYGRNPALLGFGLLNEPIVS